MSIFKNNPVVWVALAVIAVATWFWAQSFIGLTFNIDPNKVWSTLIALAFVALVIERACEVYVEPRSDSQSARTREERRAVRQQKEELVNPTPAPAPAVSPAVVAAQMAEPAVVIQPAAPGPTVEDLTAREAQLADDLSRQDKVTQKIAIGISIPLSLFVAFAGVRTLGGLLPHTAIATAEHPIGLVGTGDAQVLYLDFIQFNVLSVADVLLTAGLLAGGADGIHKILDRFIKLAADKP